MNILPYVAEIIHRTEESEDIFTLHIRLKDKAMQKSYRFQPGQFNMLYLHGVGEIPISIASDPDDQEHISHTIRAVGRVSRAMKQLQAGDQVGLRGPYGRGWPLQQVEGKDIVIATGGLGCAPVVAVINYVARRREQYGRLVIMQGVKHSKDLLWRDCYDNWAKMPNTQVLLAADVAGANWPFATGRISQLLDQAAFDVNNAAVMMCGPEGMMIGTTKDLTQRGLAESAIWLSMERNMKCAVGHCGHCQFGKDFVCKDGPVFCYADIKERLSVRGL
ncbi:MAG: FAD/NAD(P)-binding protein [Gammaproteobacteria bacterium]|nr:FAD/NAD(P)-binding protein [Gammaproteobacteria bacterium]